MSRNTHFSFPMNNPFFFMKLWGKQHFCILLLEECCTWKYIKVLVQQLLSYSLKWAFQQNSEKIYREKTEWFELLKLNRLNH